MNQRNALGYLLQGLQLAFSPGIRLYVFFPLFINIICFSIGFYFLISEFDIATQAIDRWLPDWLDWLTYLLWPIMIILTVIGSAYIFGSIANFIAAPFNGLLSEKIEAKLSGNTSATPISFLELATNSLKREWQKVKYWIPRAICLVVCFFIPIIGPIITPWLWLLFSAWMMAIQYADYPYDNHQVTFPQMRQELTKKRWLNFSFGGLVMLINSVPILNLIIMPVAVCAATAMWIDLSQEKGR